MAEIPGQSPGEWGFNHVGSRQSSGHLLLEPLHLRYELENGHLRRKHQFPHILFSPSVGCGFLHEMRWQALPHKLLKDTWCLLESHEWKSPEDSWKDLLDVPVRSGRAWAYQVLGGAFLQSHYMIGVFPKE